ncbi:MAG: FISUMP domain-containing protein [candidate division Zixibacteria bacterium]
MFRYFSLVLVMLFVIFMRHTVAMADGLVKSEQSVGLPSDNNDKNTLGEFVDIRDGQTYGWVKIGDNYWMAENLNYDTSGSWNYNNDTSNGTIYGRLYDWATAVNACPEEWHLPSVDEWTLLVNELGGSSIAGIALKNTSGWDNNGNGDNSSNLSVLPAGSRHPDGSFVGLGWLTGFWTSTPNSDDHAFLYLVPHDIPGVLLNGDRQTSGKSVRCIRCCLDLKGDANGDGDVNVGDAVYIISHVFKGGPAPNPIEAGDANCDGNCNVGDAVYLINYVFKGGPGPCEVDKKGVKTYEC